ncbi:unnamed protein product [Durusdinium trenchii]|uniref:Uncharacterized protein n=1 Tax=Durusdinium trenchii TaxID=1381693 RepID=A0ABP0P1H2_9DINO
MAEAEVVERFPATVQVVGAPEPVINQHYKRVTLAQLRQHKKVKQQMANGLDVAYMVEVAPPAQGERPDQKRRWPYIWFQHDQIKIAMMGDNSSRYFANLHPFGFGPTQQWVDAENQFLTELRVLPAKGSDTDSSEACELELEPEKEANCPQLEEVHRAELREQGFTVVGPTAAFRCAVLDALRLANMLLGAAVNWSLGNFSAPWADKLLASNSEGCHNLRVRLNDEASAPFAKVLSFILPLAEELMQEPVEVPNCCQLASLPPDGAPTSDWTSQGDQTTTYHVDGRGQLKNNIALIVGVALTPPERSSSSWGAFVCHPGSHRLWAKSSLPGAAKCVIEAGVFPVEKSRHPGPLLHPPNETVVDGPGFGDYRNGKAAVLLRQRETAPAVHGPVRRPCGTDGLGIATHGAIGASGPFGCASLVGPSPFAELELQLEALGLLQAQATFCTAEPKLAGWCAGGSAWDFTWPRHRPRRRWEAERVGKLEEKASKKTGSRTVRTGTPGIRSKAEGVGVDV